MSHLRRLFVIALAGLILLPGTVSAGGVIVAAPRSSVVISSRPHFFVHHPFVPNVVVARPFFVARPFVVARPFFPIVAAVPSAVVYAAPPVIYGAPPVVAVQPAPAVAPPAASIPTVIEYPTGWYQLRGDGVTTPYVWVWIPKPPPPPA